MILIFRSFRFDLKSLGQVVLVLFSACERKKGFLNFKIVF